MPNINIYTQKLNCLLPFSPKLKFECLVSLFYKDILKSLSFFIKLKEMFKN